MEENNISPIQSDFEQIKRLNKNGIEYYYCLVDSNNLLYGVSAIRKIRIIENPIYCFVVPKESLSSRSLNNSPYFSFSSAFRNEF